MTTNGGTTTTTSTSSSLPLYSQYPISSHWELTLTNDETVSGEVYCTDPVAEVVVLHNDLKEVRVVSVGQIRDSKQIKEADVDTASVSSGFNTAHAKKALDEREKRSLKLAQESWKSVNPKASPKGQQCFDMLLKACGEAIWKGESIVVGYVGHQVIVDPPYTPDDCKLLESGSGKGTLDRVQKVLASVGAS